MKIYLSWNNQNKNSERLQLFKRTISFFGERGHEILNRERLLSDQVISPEHTFESSLSQLKMSDWYIAELSYPNYEEGFLGGYAISKLLKKSLFLYYLTDKETNSNFSRGITFQNSYHKDYSDWKTLSNIFTLLKF